MFQAGECIADLDVVGCRNRRITASSGGNDTEDVNGCRAFSLGDVEEELKQLRSERNNLNKALVVAQQNISNQRAMLLAMSREREALKNKVSINYNKFFLIMYYLLIKKTLT